MRFVLIAILIPLCACSKSPTSPASSETTARLAGQVVSAIDGAAVAGASVRAAGQSAVTDAGGAFQVDVGAPGSYPVTLRGTAFVERETTVSAGSAGPARLSLIPATFDLESFDQMFRTSHGRLQRWTTQPHLVVVASVMNYRGGSGDDYPAVREQMSDDEVSLMVAHLTEGLALLTGGAYTSFASVVVERPREDERVRMTRERTVVAGRFHNLVTFAPTIGYGSWAEQDDGSIAGGALFLGRDFDTEDSRRRLLRIHELGHALGYQHVTSRVSIMNPSIGAEPTAHDQAGARIAFQRPPGNRAPDIDPASSPRTTQSTGGTARWTSIYCLQ